MQQTCAVDAVLKTNSVAIPILNKLFIQWNWNGNREGLCGAVHRLWYETAMFVSFRFCVDFRMVQNTIFIWLLVCCLAGFLLSFSSWIPCIRWKRHNNRIWIRCGTGNFDNSIRRVLDVLACIRPKRKHKIFVFANKNDDSDKHL